jgi:site-specific recombinase XerD
MSALRNKMIQQMQLKGYSNRTIENYTRSILGLAKYYKTAPDLLSQEQIRAYIQYNLVEKKLSKTWCNQLVSALKILFCEVLKREWNHTDIPRPRREKKLPVVLSKEEVGKLFACTRNLKHRAILILTYSAGLRLSEVKNLKMGDIDSKRMTVRVIQAKGFKDRYSILSTVALEILRYYWKSYRPTTWLFETKRAQSLPDKTVQHAFKNALRKSGIKKQIGIHSLRHSFATHMMEQGVSLPIIQQLLGHTSLRTTSVYLHVQQYTLDSIKSPLDSLSL